MVQSSLLFPQGQGCGIRLSPAISLCRACQENSCCSPVILSQKRVNLGLIAREGFSNVSYIKKCALQHTKSLKESDKGKTLKSHLNVVNFA